MVHPKKNYSITSLIYGSKGKMTCNFKTIILLFTGQKIKSAVEFTVWGMDGLEKRFFKMVQQMLTLNNKFKDKRPTSGGLQNWHNAYSAKKVAPFWDGRRSEGQNTCHLF